MKRTTRFVLPWLALFAGGLAGAASTSERTNEQLVEDVRASEIGFAKTMADRDLDAFASYVADEAIFFGRRDVLRGRASVVAGWKSFFDGEAAPFSWEPERVDVLDSGKLALSTGPVRGAGGDRIGTFNSIWRRDADGRWRVVFDKGCPYCPDETKP